MIAHQIIDCHTISLFTVEMTFIKSFFRNRLVAKFSLEQSEKKKHRSSINWDWIEAWCRLKPIAIGSELTIIHVVSLLEGICAFLIGNKCPRPYLFLAVIDTAAEHIIPRRYVIYPPEIRFEN